jgi:hypothetical protein
MKELDAIAKALPLDLSQLTSYYSASQVKEQQEAYWGQPEDMQEQEKSEMKKGKSDSMPYISKGYIYTGTRPGFSMVEDEIGHAYQYGIASKESKTDEDQSFIETIYNMIDKLRTKISDIKKENEILKTTLREVEDQLRDIRSKQNN